MPITQTNKNQVEYVLSRKDLYENIGLLKFKNINYDMINYSTNQFKRKGFPHIFGDIFNNVIIINNEIIT